jgi:integrase
MVFVPWIWFRALTGARPSESFFIEWQDIEFENDRIWIRPKDGNPIKNRRKRFIPMHPDLKPILLAWRTEWEVIQSRWWKRNGQKHSDTSAHNWVFFHPHDHDEQTKGFLRSFEHARQLSGLSRLTSYTLRHYFISQCIMSGIDHFTISKWVGQKGTRMIDYVYGHIAPDYSADEMAKLRIVPDKASSPAVVSSPHGTEAGALRHAETELAQKDVGISLGKAV